MLLGIPVLPYLSSYSDPNHLLATLHPDLPPYLASRRTQASQEAENTAMHAQASPSALPNIQVHYPLSPSELLKIMSFMTSSLLSGQIYHVLLRHTANNDLDIFSYLLSRSSIFRSYPSEINILKSELWPAHICLRLLDQNWRLFAIKAGKVVESREPGAGSVSLNEPISTSSGRSDPSVSPSASRWASRSSHSSSSSSLSFNGSNINSSTTSTFRASKLPLLADALSSVITTDAPITTHSPPRADVGFSKWSLPRWKVLIGDLDALFCKTGLLSEGEREYVRHHIEMWKLNVDFWKGGQGEQIARKPG